MDELGTTLMIYEKKTRTSRKYGSVTHIVVPNVISEIVCLL